MTPFNIHDTIPIFSNLPDEARDWLTALPWKQRRYVLSLCHLVCATPSAQQAEFLDAYTAEGLLSRIVDDADTQQRVNEHLNRFRSDTEIDSETVRKYIRQVYVHSVQDARQRPDLYLETAVMLMGSAQEHSSVLSYILGFEILKLLFSMSWEQHERLYHLQPNQDEFTREYILPVQETHKRHGIVNPKDRNKFFARREYFVKTPTIHPQRLVGMIIEAFSADKIMELGFSILRHPNAIHYDHDYIYGKVDSVGEDPVQQMKEPRASLRTASLRTIEPQHKSAESQQIEDQQPESQQPPSQTDSESEESAEELFEQLFSEDESA